LIKPIHRKHFFQKSLPRELENFIRKQCQNTINASSFLQQKPTTENHIVTQDTSPIRQRHRELALDRLIAAEKEFLQLEKSGIIRHSTSSWASLLHIVPKKDGSIRPCGDYRLLNNITQHDSYPLPLVTDILHRLDNTNIFSTIDLHKTYHQIPVATQDIPKTAVTTPFDLFEYLYIPFGLRNAAQTFQRHIDTVFSELPFAFVFIDDILVASENKEKHIQHFKIIFFQIAPIQFTS